MGSEKREFLILKDGQLMFYLANDGEASQENLQNRLLTAGYLSAILQIVENSSRGNIISNIEMGNKHVILRKGTFLSIIFVYIIHKKIKEKKENKKIEKIITNFEAMYNQEKISKWNGNVKTFDNFKPVVLNNW